ncbi:MULTISPECIES: hypothetical protein [unclassified Flavobacterium]|uniref:hypothetical protein n=1 Tax=unclassified Flavobacterium TaxID=196869 RepID=UPI001290D9D5|nr:MULTISPECIES: hypothetical protein [unclassified Flavobacterium]MQP53595.1 hypothetical protein [Flavobacterium sp. LMO9]MQP63549.1 hypothetical protein [Flavobacterium sp. LMO6]
MKIKCIETKATNFNLEEVNTITSNNFDYNFGGHGLKLNEVYNVIGMLLYKDTKYLYYLIDINNKPYWFPNELFLIIDNNVPENWNFNIFNKSIDDDIYMIFGYKELCFDEEHYNQLIEREKDALNIYFKNKR